MVANHFTSAGPVVGRHAGPFDLLRTRQQIAGLSFPSPDDYSAMAAGLIAAGGSSAKVFEAAQRDWFRRGQTGCLFARLAAYEPEERWPYFVHAGDRISSSDVRWIEESLAAQEARPASEVVSVLFPGCRSLSAFRDWLLQLVDGGVLWEERRGHHEGGTTYELRRTLVSGDTAWVMGFGPSRDLPTTRQAPFYELAMRVKPKPNRIYHRLNPERGIAHLADFPMVMNERHWDHRWASTERRTRRILGGDPDYVSAARSTLTVRNED